jgi:hypothetical protein
MNILIEIIGWAASVLIVGAYIFNITGKLQASSPIYIWSNLIGGIFFVIYTYHKGAISSMFVNIVWVVVAVITIAQNIIKGKKAYRNKK